MRTKERNVLIVPAYIGAYAKNRDELYQNIKSKSNFKINFTNFLKGTHSCGFDSHKITNFERFEKPSSFIQGTDEFYPSLLVSHPNQHHHSFEPYFIAPKSIPMYSS